MTRARERIRGAQAALDAGFPDLAVSAAYYAAFSAAHAALSEEDRYGKTHRGVWNLFRELFVVGARFDARLLAGATRLQALREAGDYEARPISGEEAAEAIAVAEAFVAAVVAMLDQ